MGSFNPGAAHVEQDQRECGDAEQEQRGPVGRGVGEILDLVVDGDGKRASGAGNIAADHEHDTKLAHGMREAERGRGDQGMAGQGQQDAGEDAKATRSEEPGLVDESGVDRAKAGSQGLDREREAIDNGADHEPGKGEGKGMAEDAGSGASETGPGSEENEEIETKDGGGKKQGKGGKGFDQRTPTRLGEGEPAGEGNGKRKQDKGGDSGKTYGEPEGLQVDHGMGSSPAWASFCFISGV